MRNEQEAERRRAEIARQQPALDQLVTQRHEMILRSIRTAFSGGAAADAESVMLSYNQKIAEGLRAAGYPADYLSPIADCPLCQDTGAACVFVELGQDVHIEGGLLVDAVNEGVRQGYADGYLRKSMVADPLRRVNTKTNEPALIHTDIVAGDELRITIAPKGAGSENMSKIKMLKPADGREGVVEFVLDAVRAAGPNPCPPIVVGVGIGGNFDHCAKLAKKALTRTLGQVNPDPYYAEMEAELLEAINGFGTGPAGFGGATTALAVHVEQMPTHIACLPVAVNINCHVARHETMVL